MKKMKKLLALIAICIMCFTTTTTAMAAPKTAKCTPAQMSTVNYKLAVAAQDTANCTVKVMVAVAQATRIDDSKACEIACNGVVEVAKMTIKCLGFGVDCEYDYYVVDGKTICVDPIKVITPIGGGGDK